MRTTVGDLVLGALRERGESWPSKTIAGELARKHPEVFGSDSKATERARCAVRRYRGNQGNKHRAGTADKTHFRPPGHQIDGNIPLPAPLPPPTASGAVWDIFPADFRRALAIMDVHIPYHDPASLDLALRHGVDRGADCVILNGDLMDFYSVSYYERNPVARSLADEIEAGKLFLEHLRERFPKARILYKEGNHEERLWRFCFTRCPELFAAKGPAGEPILSLNSLLDCAEYGVEVIADKRPIRCGKHLHALHGHEFRAPFVNPVNPARGLYLRAQCNAFCGDLHQSSNHTQTGLTEIVSCWSVGALCNLHPTYMPINKWNTGFAIIELDKTGRFSFENKKIIKGEILPA